jgi:hypothetical protein
MSTALAAFGFIVLGLIVVPPIGVLVSLWTWFWLEILDGVGTRQAWAETFGLLKRFAPTAAKENKQ